MFTSIQEFKSVVKTVKSFGWWMFQMEQEVKQYEASFKQYEEARKIGEMSVTKEMSWAQIGKMADEMNPFSSSKGGEGNNWKDGFCKGAGDKKGENFFSQRDNKVHHFGTRYENCKMIIGHYSK